MIYRVGVIVALVLALLAGPASARGSGSHGSRGYHGPKTVHVHSYTTKKGTRVHSYNRAAPHR
jgi:hypothetical protein